MRLPLLFVIAFVAAHLVGCGDVECDRDADCRSGEVCAEAGGVLFASRVCVAAEAPPSDASMPQSDMGSDGGSDACIARSAQVICTSLRAECGAPPAVECGASIDLDCGRCDANERCGETFECECVPETDDEFCARFGADCGDVSNLDNCGVQRAINCGTCTGTDTCGEFQANVCGCPCEIEGVCYPPNTANPNNPCQRCLPDVADDQWTTTEGETCSDGDLCTENDVCNSSAECVGEPVICEASAECRTSACDPMTGACVENQTPNGQICGVDEGLSCAANACLDGSCERQIDGGSCLIDNTCYPDGATNPVAECQLCRSFMSQTTWSFQNSGRRCSAGGLICTDGRCNDVGECVISIENGECLIDGVCREERDTNPQNPCEECDPEVSQTIWSAKKVGESCSSPTMLCQCDGMGTCLDLSGNQCI